MASLDVFSPGSIIAGKLRIVRQVGEGGMGAVYEVEHELTHHRRALKMLHADMARVPGVVERFLREASAAGRIGNTHIVETFDAGRLEGGEPYIVMELLQGRTLAELLEAQGRLPIDTTCELLIQACDGVGAAHAAGIVHRDLKPENLFLVGSERPFVKLLDFGISKFDSGATGVAGFTLEGSPIGTPHYMSPEQVRGETSIDPRTDVYALGVVFYECLTGRKPFVAEALPHLAVLIHQGEYPLASQVCPGLPTSVDVLVGRAMAPQAASRYASAAELAQALQVLRSSLPQSPPAELQVTQALERPPPEPSLRALTPAVFSRTAGFQRKRARGLWLLVGVSTVAIGSLAAWLFGRGGEAKPAALTPLPEAAVSAPPAEPPRGTPTLDPLPNDAPAAPSAAPPSAPASQSATRLPTPAQSSLPAAPRASSSASRSRANAHGLSEDNPFK